MKWAEKQPRRGVKKHEKAEQHNELYRTFREKNEKNAA